MSHYDDFREADERFRIEERKRVACGVLQESILGADLRTLEMLARVAKFPDRYQILFSFLNE